MSQEAAHITQVLADNGWLVATMTTTWALVLRVMIGRHLKAIDSMQSTLVDIEQRLSKIEGRMLERDKYGRTR